MIPLEAYFTSSTVSRSLHDDHVSLPAPVAPMMASSSARPLPTGRLPVEDTASRSRGRPSGLFSPPRLRSTGKSTQDFQAEVDRTEMARDQADPDYRLSQSTPKKRRATSDVSPKSAKKRSPGHIPYNSCTDSGSRTERDRHLARIRENWGPDTEQWMPRSVWPNKVLRVSGRKSRRQPVENPLDWNCPLLEGLSYLSAVTKGQPDVAYRALEDAVAQRQEADDSHEVTQLFREDVQVATQICKDGEPRYADQGAASPAGSVSEEVETEARVNDAPNGLPALRSPTFVSDDPIIKVESLPNPMPRPMETLASGIWTGYDDELDKLEESRLEAEEHEAVAAAKRAQREQLRIRRQIRERMRQHGHTKEDAIPVGSDAAI